MLEDRNGTLWVGTLSDGILKFDRARQRFTRYRNDPANDESLSENRITTLFEDREGNLWTGFHATEPGFFMTRALPFTRLPFDARNPNNLGEKLVNVLYEDRHGILWMERPAHSTGSIARAGSSRTSMSREMESRAKCCRSSRMLPSGCHVGSALAARAVCLDTAAGRLQAFRHDDKDSTSLSDNGSFVFSMIRAAPGIGTSTG